MKNLKLTFISIFLLIAIYTQGKSLDDFRLELKKSYIVGNLDDWPERIQEMEEYSDGSFDWQFEILEARYGLIGYYLGKGERKKAREHLDGSQSHLSSMMTQYPDSSKLHSVQTGFYGFQIALSILNAPAFYPKMKKSLKKAFELNPNEPRAWMEKGNLNYNRPAAFGSNKLEAIENYHQALTLLQQEKNSYSNWMIIMVRVFLIKAYYHTNQKENYQEAKLDLENKYGKMNWVSDFLDARIIH